MRLVLKMELKWLTDITDQQQGWISCATLCSGLYAAKNVKTEMFNLDDLFLMIAYLIN